KAETLRRSRESDLELILRQALAAGSILQALQGLHLGRKKGCKLYRISRALCAFGDLISSIQNPSVQIAAGRLDLHSCWRDTDRSLRRASAEALLSQRELENQSSSFQQISR